MCGNCKDGKCGALCITALIAKILVIVGGINWGLIGVSMLFGGSNWNLVSLLLGSGIVASIVYLLVGISAIMMIFGCKCGKCIGTCKVEGPTSTPSAEQSM